jgi:phosphoribosyl transferase domain protein
MIQKEFLEYTTVRDNGFTLARKIIDEGYIPDIIYTSMRGGAYLGNVVSEFFKVAYHGEKKILYSTVVAHSYSGVRSSSKIVLDGWTYPPEDLKKDMQILIVDDIFDSGETINFLVKDLVQKGLNRENIKVAVHDYKSRHNKNEKLQVIPDWWCRKHDIYSEKDDIWIHYMSHELVGLTEEELEEHYFKNNPLLRKVFEGVKC